MNQAQLFMCTRYPSCFIPLRLSLRRTSKCRLFVFVQATNRATYSVCMSHFGNHSQHTYEVVWLTRLTWIPSSSIPLTRRSNSQLTPAMLIFRNGFSVWRRTSLLLICAHILIKKSNLCDFKWVFADADALLWRLHVICSVRFVSWTLKMQRNIFGASRNANINATEMEITNNPTCYRPNDDCRRAQFGVKIYGRHSAHICIYSRDDFTVSDQSWTKYGWGGAMNIAT